MFLFCFYFPKINKNIWVDDDFSSTACLVMMEDFLSLVIKPKLWGFFTGTLWLSQMEKDFFSSNLKHCQVPRGNWKKLTKISRINFDNLKKLKLYQVWIWFKFLLRINWNWMFVHAYYSFSSTLNFKSTSQFPIGLQLFKQLQTVIRQSNK